MLREIKKNIEYYRSVKYQKILFSKKNILLREKAIQYIYKLSKLDDNKNKCLSCNFYSKNLNYKNFIKFYKKFNSNIQLKAKYNIYSLQKNTNTNACFKSYIIFSNFVMNSKKINKIQKLNTILKVNDLLILMFEKDKHSNLINLFKKNIQREKKLLNSYL